MQLCSGAAHPSALCQDCVRHSHAVSAVRPPYQDNKPRLRPQLPQRRIHLRLLVLRLAKFLPDRRAARAAADKAGRSQLHGIIVHPQLAHESERGVPARVLLHHGGQPAVKLLLGDAAGRVRSPPACAATNSYGQQ